MERRKLIHEVREDFGNDGESLPCVCMAGPTGDGCRQMLTPMARLLTTFEAGSHFEAMTTYYRLMGFGAYTTDQQWDFQPYSEEWTSH